MRVVVEVDAGDLARLRAKLKTERIGRAISAALNRAGDSSTTAAKRAVAKQLGLPQKRVAEGLASTKANPSKLVYAIKASDRHFPLSDFKARETRKGVSAAPWGKRQLFDSTFFVPRYGGGVYAREGAERGPIHQLWGGSVRREIERDQAPEEIRRVATEQMKTRMQHELNRLFGGA